jgi:hypothetical protein
MNLVRTFLLLATIPTLLAAAAPPRAKTIPAQSDAAIEQNIRARFAKSKIAEDKFAVRVQGGVAIIEGNTRIMQRKGAATRLAKAGGARSVDNRIRIADDVLAAAVEKLRESKPRKSDKVSVKPSDPTQAKKVISTTSPGVPATIPRAVVKH